MGLSGRTLWLWQEKQLSRKIKRLKAKKLPYDKLVWRMIRKLIAEKTWY
jgi:hypothetical protein